MWDTVVSIWSTLSGPLIGALIGCGTNYIAVKMLFRPLFPKKLFGKRIPFTPGIIPKRQPALARTIGVAVGRDLLTADDLAAMLASDKVKTAVVDEITSALQAVPADLVADAAGDKLAERVCQLGIGDLIAKKGGEAIKARVKGTMLAMFVSDDTIRTITTTLGSQVEDYVKQNSSALIRSVITGDIQHVLPMAAEAAADAAASAKAASLPEPALPLLEGTDTTATKETAVAEAEGLLSAIGISEDAVRDAVAACYDSFVEHKVHAVTDHLDVAGTVESKIAAMSPKDLETLVLSVMKKELNAIVWLGAVLGFLMGMLNFLK